MKNKWGCIRVDKKVIKEIKEIAFKEHRTPPTIVALAIEMYKLKGEKNG